MNDRSASGHLVAALLLFAISVLAAMLMVLTALVVWLSSLTGSFVLSAVIIGAFFALVALAIYRFSICEELRRIRTQIETVYEVAYVFVIFEQSGISSRPINNRALRGSPYSFRRRAAVRCSRSFRSRTTAIRAA